MSWRRWVYVVVLQHEHITGKHTRVINPNRIHGGRSAAVTRNEHHPEPGAPFPSVSSVIKSSVYKYNPFVLQ